MKFAWSLILIGGLALAGCNSATLQHGGNESSTTQSGQSSHEIADLLEHEWLIEDIAGKGIIDNSRPSIQFSKDGNVAGNASCNRFFGQYRIKDEQLRFGDLASTMMACPEALMNQENTLLKRLRTVTHWEIDATGTLILHTSENEKILARR